MSTQEQREAAAAKIFGDWRTFKSDSIHRWVETGINADDHTGLDLGGADDLAELFAEREAALQERVTMLTAERDHFRKRLVETDTEASEARADNARHLETIRVLRGALWRTQMCVRSINVALEATEFYDVKDEES